MIKSGKYILTWSKYIVVTLKINATWFMTYGIRSADILYITSSPSYVITEVSIASLKIAAMEFWHFVVCYRLYDSIYKADVLRYISRPLKLPCPSLTPHSHRAASILHCRNLATTISNAMESNNESIWRKNTGLATPRELWTNADAAAERKKIFCMLKNSDALLAILQRIDDTVVTLSPSDTHDP